MTDIDLYAKSTKSYEDLQKRRPDYSRSLNVLNDLVNKYLNGREDLVIADFCSGTGSNSKLICKNHKVNKVTLIDINKEFLNIAKDSGINAKNVEIIESDILDVVLEEKYDLVISMFAYHHVKDADKIKYIEIAKNSLKAEGILILGEIYLPDRSTTLKYYDYLLNSIPSDLRAPELEKFLEQTAQSEDFEYKVSQEFAHSQLKNSGFNLLESVKIWPLDDSFEENIGTFVEVWKK